MFWLILLIALYFFSLLCAGFIFDNNGIGVSVITIALGVLPIVNSIFVISKFVFDLHNGKYSKDINDVKKLFKKDEKQQ